jgi:hypothetical protein
VARGGINIWAAVAWAATGRLGVAAGAALPTATDISRKMVAAAAMAAGSGIGAR